MSEAIDKIHRLKTTRRKGHLWKAQKGRVVFLHLAGSRESFHRLKRLVLKLERPAR